MKQSYRHYLYLVLIAVQPLLLFYGIASEQEIALWVGAISTVAGLGLAQHYSSRRVEVSATIPTGAGS